MVQIKKMITLAGAAAVMAFGGLAVETVNASPAQAQCAFGGFGGFGGGFCDTDYWPDGSYNHCISVAAFGYGHDGPAVDRPAPRLGEHSRAILAESGYGPDEIAGLERDGAVVAA